MKAIAAIAVIIGVLTLSQGNGSGQDQDPTIRAGGSTTLLPIMANCGSEFMERFPTWDRVDAALPKKNTTVFVTGGGSGFGVKSLMSGVIDLGMVSRELKDAEKKALGEHQAHLVGKDAVAIAVNTRNPLAQRKKGFAPSELAAIFSGEVKTYQQLDRSLPAKPIVLLTRDAGAGSTEIFQERILGEKKLSPKALQLPSQGALLEKLQSNNNAIAYISSGLVQKSNQLKAFPLDNVEPTDANITGGSYSLARPLLVVVKGAPAPALRHFIDYTLNSCQKLVVAHGYVPSRSVN
ncbi:MAG TPA: phosphate ABC transporter substrate-binding protein [Candidatus Binatia bacterium]|jgi:phosphate transport system substrate-binding protein